jgi:hypothetical protein
MVMQFVISITGATQLVILIHIIVYRDRQTRKHAKLSNRVLEERFLFLGTPLAAITVL